jgi:hypothetical protein
MTAGPRTYVSTAFVPFTHRRVDAVADLLVDGLRANDLHAERLRLPVDTSSPQAMAAAAAAAALVDVAWAHQMIQLEFPCLQLLHDRAAAWRVRGGLVCDLTPAEGGGLGLLEADVSSRFEDHWVEPGAVDGAASPAIAAPPGLLTHAVMRAGLVQPDGTGTVVVSLAAQCDARAAEIAATYERVHVVTAADASRAMDRADDLEEVLWRAIATVRDQGFAGVHVLMPADADPVFVERGPDAAGDVEAWSTVQVDGTSSVLVPHGSGLSRDAIGAQWAELAAELVP